MIIKEGYSLLEQISLFHSVMTKPLHQELRGGMIGTILQSVPTLEKI